MMYRISWRLFAPLIAFTMIVQPDFALAATFKVLYTFNGNDGRAPVAAPILDAAGNLYGTTYSGYGRALTSHQEKGLSCLNNGGCGIAYELSTNGTLKVLESFTGSNGAAPIGGLISDKKGNLFGTTEAGGVVTKLCGRAHCGTVFELPSGGGEKVLHDFEGKSDGEQPFAGLTMDNSGTLYGTTADAFERCRCGTIFKVSSDGKETVLHTFAGGSDGAYPYYGTLLIDTTGNLYGTTSAGGGSGCGGMGCGTVFKLATDGTETILHAFAGGSDGEDPSGGLIADNAGNLYGTTYTGGGGKACPNNVGCGTIFKVAPDGTETVLYVFTGGSDGANPTSSLVSDTSGNLYGTTTENSIANAYGNVFELSSTGVETVLYAFTGGSDGVDPTAGLSIDESGNLYGAAYAGGSFGYGTLFEVTP